MNAHVVALVGCVGENFVFDEGLPHETPVNGEGIVEGSDSGACDAGVEVAPDAEFAAVDVAVGDVHAADVAHLAVNDANFAVVAPVDVRGERFEGDAEEGIDFDAVFAHFAEEPVARMEGADVVVDDADFDAFFRLFDEEVFESCADDVVFDDVVLQEDIFAGESDVGFKRGEFLAAGGEEADVVVGVVERIDEVVGEVDFLFALVGELKRADIDGRVDLFPEEPAFIAAGNHAFVLDATPEEEVENHSEEGEDEQHSDPSQRLDGVAVFRQDNGGDTDDGEDIDHHKRPVNDGNAEELRYRFHRGESDWVGLINYAGQN